MFAIGLLLMGLLSWTQYVIEAHDKRCAHEREGVKGVGKLNEDGTITYIVHRALQDNEYMLVCLVVVPEYDFSLRVVWRVSISQNYFTLPTLCLISQPLLSDSISQSNR